MSWSASWDVIPGPDTYGPQNLFESNIESKEHQKQYYVAKEAVATVLNYNALGSPVNTYSVNVSGHGNPDNKPVEGWSNDFIQISIVQVTEGKE